MVSLLQVARLVAKNLLGLMLSDTTRGVAGAFLWLEDPIGSLRKQRLELLSNHGHPIPFLAVMDSEPRARAVANATASAKVILVTLHGG